jgi:hypothetical protein
MKKLLLLWVFVSAIVAFAHAQDGESNCNDNLDNDGDGLVDCRDCANKVCEVSNDGIDNDADGFIDCYDKETSVDAACNGFFIGKNLFCEARPTTFPPFAVTEDFHSPLGVTQHLSKLLVGDVDGDKIPEIISIYRNQDNEGAGFISKLSILSGPGNGGTETITKAQRETQADGVYLQHEGDIAMADIDRDGDAEIFVVSGKRSGSNDWAIMAYTFNKATQSIDKFWSVPVAVPTDPGNVGLADFDGDLKVELYGRDRIFDAHTGVEMGKGNNLSGTDWKKESSGSTAVDILATNECADCDGLELIAGCRIYSVKINRGGTPSATVTKVKERSEYFTRTGANNDNSTSIADFDLDGFLDVVAVGSNGADNANTTIFYWNLHKGNISSAAVNQGELKTFIDNAAYPNGWKNGAGRVNIADIDGDGKLNLVYVSGRFLYALRDGNTALEQVWRELVTEETSGITGCTLFDFNADGTSEIVYRDEENLFIFTSTFPTVNGLPDYTQNSTVTKSSPVVCKSRTFREYPIVADVDADGSTEICVTCSTNETVSGNAGFVAGRNLSLYDGAQVRVFKSANEPWVPARRVWNQHGYFVVNVNDDLTIPVQQQLHQSIYARNVVCLDGRDSRPLNNFLNQAPFLNSQGCPSFAAPNLAFSGGLANITVAPPTCPQKDFTITFEIINKGDVSITGTVPVIFYNGNPLTATATKIGQVDLQFNNVLPGGEVKLESQPITGPGSNFELYIVINSDGINKDGTTLPVMFPNTDLRECDYTDNIINVTVSPAPAPLGVEVLKDNIVCVGGATDPLADGEAKAFVIGAGNTQITQNFTFTWSNGDFVNSPSDYSNNPSNKTGSIYSGLANGTYTVYATHNTIGCGSVEMKVDINDNPVAPPTVEIKDIDIVNPTSCKTPNGQLKVTVTGGSSNYTYQWLKGTEVGVGVPIGTGSTIGGLGGGSYAVEVTDVATGCYQRTEETLTAPTSPTVTADVKDSDCSLTPKGEAFVTNVTTNIKYIWYEGDANTWFTVSAYGHSDKLPSGFEGVKYENLDGGKYSVIGYDDATKCLSLPVVKEVKQTTAPQVTISDITAQTSCDPAVANKNGAATASVNGGPATYTFAWFKGQSTTGTPFLTHTSVNTSTATNLPVGTYSVKVTDEITTCSTIIDQNINIINDIATYEVVLSPTDKTVCTSDGEMRATVLVDGIADPDQSNYTFFWYKGQTKKPAVDFPGNTDNVLENAEPNFYTVYARHNTLKCETNPEKGQVQNLVPALSVTFKNEVRPSNCNDTGVLRFNIAPSSPSFTDPTAYDIKWFRGTDTNDATKLISVTEPGSAITNIYDGAFIVSEAIGLRSGVYTMLATNPHTGCPVSLTRTLKYLNAPEVDVIPTQVTTCDLGTNLSGTNGSLQIDIQVTDGAKDATDYWIYIYENDFPGLSGPTPTGFKESHEITTAGTTYTYNTLLPYGIGKYTVVVFDEDISCATEEADEITGDINYPIISQVSEEDSHCDTDGNGRVTVSIEDLSGSAISNYALYNFNWKLGATVLSDYNSNIDGSTINIGENARDGVYTIEVRELATNCMTSIDANVISDEMLISVDAIPTDAINCALNGTTPLADADARVVKIVEVNKNASTTHNEPVFPNYSFAWSNGATGTPELVNVLGVGLHFVEVTNSLTGCNAKKSFEVLNKTMGTVLVDLVDFKKQEICITPSTGHLEVLASGTGATYSYAWTSSVPAFTATTPRITGLTFVNTYTVSVTNNDNGCKTSETYSIDKLINPIPVVTSKMDLTTCAPLNGSVEATVIDEQAPADYTFVWTYNDITHNNNVVALSTAENIITGLGVTTGISVKAIDNENSSECQSDLILIPDILDLRVFPTVIASEAAPVTNCVNPFNGVASASVAADDNSNYTFNWYEGSAVVPPPAFTGVEYGNLSSAIYTVEAVHRITGCIGTDQIEITNQPVPVPMPVIEILSHVTSCEPGNNGALASTVNGKIVGYTFDWYDGKTEKPSPDFVGDTYTNLFVGFYSVMATDNETGCRSPLVSEELLFKPKYPDFEFIVVNATCADPSLTNGQPNGAVTLILMSDVEVSTVNWTHQESGEQFNETNIQNASPGKYMVTVTSTLGCPTEKEVEIGTEIHPFNGVSRNGDGYNDIFFINCIENFPRNLVKIFNRAGTLVYEAEGYDNADTFFDGQSNKGVSLMGTNVPDGTYFYIIDKRDGSKPLAGYLEVVN